MLKHDIKTLYTEKQEVKTHEVDLYKQMTMPALLNRFQDLATAHADHLGFGYADLFRQKRFWALSRMHIELGHVPCWKDQVTLLTWTNGLTGIFANRNWQVKLGEQVQVSAYADWLILDAETRRPVRGILSDFEHKVRPEVATQSKTVKLMCKDELHHKAKFYIGFSQFDMNGHVNNVSYMAWILDSLGLDWLRTHEAKMIDINYLKEIKLDVEKVELLCNESCTYFVISSSNAGEHARIQIQWKDRSKH